MCLLSEVAPQPMEASWTPAYCQTAIYCCDVLAEQAVAPGERLRWKQTALDWQERHDRTVPQ